VVRTAPSDAGFVAGDRQDPRPHRLVVRRTQTPERDRSWVLLLTGAGASDVTAAARGSVHGARAAGAAGQGARCRASTPATAGSGWLAVAAGKAAAARPGGLSLLPLPATQTHTSRHAQCPWPSMRKGIRCPDAVRPATLSLPSASGLCCS